MAASSSLAWTSADASITSATTCAGTQTGAQLRYDNEDRLSAWQNAPSDPIATDSFLYDGEGNRVAQVAVSGGATTTTTYVGSLEEIATTGSTTTTTAYYGGLALSVNGTLSYTLSDGLGSVSEAVALDGSVTATQLYGPYGAVRYQSGTLPGTRAYTGQHADATTGLDYYNARYYDPVAGQFSSSDTMLAGGLNRYAYVGGNPETRTDPSGHSTFIPDAPPIYQEAPAPSGGAADTGVGLLTLIAGFFAAADVGLASIFAPPRHFPQGQRHHWHGNGAPAPTPTVYVPWLTNPADDASLNQSDADKLKPPVPTVSSGSSDTGNGSDTGDGSGAPPTQPTPSGAGAGQGNGDGGKCTIPLSRYSYILGQNLEKAGDSQPQSGDAAHHIVQKSRPRAQPARDILDRFGIDINSADNGVWLSPSVHSHVHTNAYADYVNDQLGLAASQPGATADDIRAVLDSIRQQLLTNGSCP